VYFYGFKFSGKYDIDVRFTSRCCLIFDFVFFFCRMEVVKLASQHQRHL
jgi:hypothetical protein